MWTSLLRGQCWWYENMSLLRQSSWTPCLALSHRQFRMSYRINAKFYRTLLELLRSISFKAVLGFNVVSFSLFHILLNGVVCKDVILKGRSLRLQEFFPFLKVIGCIGFIVKRWLGCKWGLICKCTEQTAVILTVLWISTSYQFEEQVSVIVWYFCFSEITR